MMILRHKMSKNVLPISLKAFSDNFDSFIHVDEISIFHFSQYFESDFIRCEDLFSTMNQKLENYQFCQSGPSNSIVISGVRYRFANYNFRIKRRRESVAKNRFSLVLRVFSTGSYYYIIRERPLMTIRSKGNVTLSNIKDIKCTMKKSRYADDKSEFFSGHRRLFLMKICPLIQLIDSS